MRCIPSVRDGHRALVAIVASRAPSLPPVRDWIVRPRNTR
jgi:hypothetical protein